MHFLRARARAATLIFILLPFVPALADIVYLRTGKTVEGTIVWQNPREVGIQVDGVVRVIGKDDINRIVYGDPEAQRRQLAEEAARAAQAAEAKRRADAENARRIAAEAERRAAVQKREALAQKQRELEAAAALQKQKEEAEALRKTAAREEEEALARRRDAGEVPRLWSQFQIEQQSAATERTAAEKRKAGLKKEEVAITREPEPRTIPVSSNIATDNVPVKARHLTLGLGPVSGTYAPELEKKTARDRQTSITTLAGGAGANLPWTNRGFRGLELNAAYEAPRWFAAYEVNRIVSRPSLTGGATLDTTLATFPATITTYDKGRFLEQTRTVQTFLVGQDISPAGWLENVFTKVRILAGLTFLSNGGPFEYDSGANVSVLSTSGQSMTATTYAVTSASAKGPLLGLAVEKSLTGRWSITGRYYLYNQDGTWRSRTRSIQYSQLGNSTALQVKMANEDSSLSVNGRRVDVGVRFEAAPGLRAVFSCFEDKSVYTRQKVTYVSPDSGNLTAASIRGDFITHYAGGATGDRVEGVKLGVEMDVNF
ncbi:MAG: hypothetical protein HY042_13075 [Spirochaetia bacterium]|nr:hypothetical protein [Spirochaetia bacterium]